MTKQGEVMEEEEAGFQIENMLEIREWLKDLLFDGGAKVTGGGMGMGGDQLGTADVEFEYKGRGYWIMIKDEGER